MKTIASRITRLATRARESVCPHTIASAVRSMTAELDPEAIPALIGLLGHTHDARDSVFRALLRYGEHAEDSLRAVANDSPLAALALEEMALRDRLLPGRLLLSPRAMPMNALHRTTDDTTSNAKSQPMNRTMMTKKTALRSFRITSDEQHDAADNAATLRASQLTHIAAEEIAWFFTSYDDAPGARLARSTIEDVLATLTVAERRALALRFDVAPWPEDLQAEGFKSGFALAVHLVAAAPWGGKSNPRDRNHRRVSEHLEAAVREQGTLAMGDVGRRADRAFTEAVRAYAKARGRAPSLLPARAA